MNEWKDLPKERHYEVFELLDRGCEVEARGTDYGWYKVKVHCHRVDGALVFDNNVGLGMVPNRQFRYREPEPEWSPIAVPTAHEIARLLSVGCRVQVSMPGTRWYDVWANEYGAILYKSKQVLVGSVPMCRDDKWRYSK